MRMADVIRQAKDAGATSVELYPDGAIKSMTFGQAPVVKKEKSRQDVLEEEKEARNPRRNAMDLAVEMIAEDSQRPRTRRGKA